MGGHGAVSSMFCAINYANFDGHTLALTPAGLIVQNSILAELL